jgi:hypothetical protein
MTCKNGPRIANALLVGLLAFSCSSWSALAETQGRKKAPVATHGHYYLYYSGQNSLPLAPRPVGDDRRFCYLPSEGCDNNHTVTN